MGTFDDKTCTKCGTLKPISEFHSHVGQKDGRQSRCKECLKVDQKIYYNDVARQRRGCESMSENKHCSQYLGIVIAERLCKHIFNQVEVMPNNNKGFDIICNKGKKIDVKSGTTLYNKGKYPHWNFRICGNKTADYFVLIAFDNRIDLNPLYLWIIPGSELNNLKGSAGVSPSTIHKWDKWIHDVNETLSCCADIKNEHNIKDEASMRTKGQSV